MDPVVSRIIQRMKEMGLDQKTFAREVEIRPQSITEWKQGISVSYSKRIVEIAAALDTTVEYLLTGEEKKPGPEQGAELIPGWSDLSTENKIRTQEYIALLLASQRKD